MKKRWALLIVVLALLVAATPVLASGGGNQGGNQNGHQNQEQNQNQEENQDQEQNQGEGQSQEQNQNQERNQDQEQNGQHHGGRQPASLPGKQLFTLTGNISALESSAITVMVRNGNRFVKPYVGQDLVVSVTDGTMYRMYTPGGCLPIAFEDLEVGDSVSVVGSVAGDGFTAQRVTVDVPCCTP
ncbi:MAG TPA: hypothetical protein PKO09_14055 [Anaerolineae bacterium]|nr:hypothetical protein [Anaerolineae bacterium]